MDLILEILKYTIPAIVVLITTAIIVNKFLSAETRKRELSVLQEGLKITMSLRLQAYERLSVFLERMNPRSLIPRVYQSGMTVQGLRIALINAIKQEFDYNLSQQIYISSKLWQAITNIKEQELAMINKIASTLKPEAAAQQLHQRILDYIMSEGKEELPVVVGLDMVRNEAKLVLSQNV